MNERQRFENPKLARVRKPRVHITYEVETYGADRERELPFVVGVLADFSGDRNEKKPLPSRRFYRTDVDNFKEVMIKIGPRLELDLDQLLKVELDFSSVDDFTPKSLVERTPSLTALWRARNEIARPEPKDATEIRQSLESGGLEADILGPPGKTPNEIISAIDDFLSAILTSIIRHPDFRRLEATWRSLWDLVLRTESSDSLWIEILDVTKSELIRDQDKAVAVDQSILFKLIYEDRFGLFGGTPYSVLIGGFEFSNRPLDIQMLAHLAEIASHASSPFIAAASPALLGFEDFAELEQIRDLRRRVSTAEFVAWRAFRESDNARWVGLTAPGVLLRRPYHWITEDPPPFAFSEDTGVASDLLWGNAAFALASCMTRAFAEEHWPANITGTEGGGLIGDLPTWAADARDGSWEKICVRAGISYQREHELFELGVIPLLQFKGTDRAVFPSVPSCHQPQEYNSLEATGNARVLSRIPTILICARFAHYLKLLVRDRVGSFIERGDIERLLNTWLARYVSHNPTPSPEQKARYPLRDARVDVTEALGRPGMYQATVYIRPQLGTSGINVSLRFAITLPAKA